MPEVDPWDEVDLTLEVHEIERLRALVVPALRTDDTHLYDNTVWLLNKLDAALRRAREAHSTRE